LHAESRGLAPSECRIAVRDVPGVPCVPVSPPILPLNKWRRSPVFQDRPDPCRTIAENDQNSWEPVSVVSARPLPEHSWTILRSEFTPFACHRWEGGLLHFTGIAEKAEVWLNGAKLAEKTDPADDAMSVPIPASFQDSWCLNPLIESRGADPADLAGPVHLSHSTGAAL